MDSKADRFFDMFIGQPADFLQRLYNTRPGILGAHLDHVG